MIEADQRLKVVAEAGDGQTALERIQALRPDIALLDVDMPQMDGFAVAREIRAQQLPVEIIFLTIHREEELFQAALDLGVKGYVLKDFRRHRHRHQHQSGRRGSAVYQPIPLGLPHQPHQPCHLTQKAEARPR